MRKQCFSTFFETLSTKFAKNAEKQRFLSFLHDVLQKVWESSVFSRFSRHFVRSSQQMRKTAFFENLAWCPAKSVRKECFLTFFETLCTKFAKKKTACRKTAFFLYKVRKKCEKTAFFSFLHDVLQKMWENSVFSRFSRHFLQSSQKMPKNSVFWAFCTMSCKKC